MDDQYNNLAKAIVIEACEDYIFYKRLCYRFDRYEKKRKATPQMNLKHYRAMRELKEVTDFLMSDRCILYTGGIDGKTILHHLDERIV